jgi:hypothetical protein
MATRVLSSEHGRVRIEAYVNGSKRPDVTVWRIDRAHVEHVQTDSLNPASASERERLCATLPEELRDDALRAGGELGALVAQARASRKDLGARETGGSAVHFPSVEPWADEVRTAELLEEIRATITRYVIVPESASIAVPLWILFAWAHDVALVSAILAILSPEKRCGKTTLLSVLLQLVPRPLTSSNITTAALFRTIEKFEPTFLLDEAETFLHENEELRGVLNSGHSRATAFTMRLVGDTHEPRSFRTWGPKVIAGIGKPLRHAHGSSDRHSYAPARYGRKDSAASHGSRRRIRADSAACRTLGGRSQTAACR